MTDAEKKWEDHCKRVFYLGPPEERIVAMAILKDFKQALREATMKRIEELTERQNKEDKGSDDWHWYNTMLAEDMRFINMLDTVTPK